MSLYQVGFLFVALPVLQYLLGPSMAIKPWVLFEPYVLFWLVMPFSWTAELSLLISFTFGAILDIVFPPYGLHCFSGLWVWALRGWWIQFIRPFQVSDEVPRPETFSLGEWTLYAFPLCSLYLLSYYLLQTLSWEVLLWAILSASYSFLGTLVLFAIFVRGKDAK